MFLIVFIKETGMEFLDIFHLNLYLINNVEDIVVFLGWSEKAFKGTVVNRT